MKDPHEKRVRERFPRLRSDARNQMRPPALHRVALPATQNVLGPDVPVRKEECDISNKPQTANFRVVNTPGGDLTPPANAAILTNRLGLPAGCSVASRVSVITLDTTGSERLRII
jgi:hypothetical protein